MCSQVSTYLLSITPFLMTGAKSGATEHLEYDTARHVDEHSLCNPSNNNEKNVYCLLWHKIPSPDFSMLYMFQSK